MVAWYCVVHNHLMRCEELGDWRSHCLRVIGMKCEELRTHRITHAMLIRGLRAFFQGQDGGIVATGYSADLETLIHSQNAIG